MTHIITILICFAFIVDTTFAKTGLAEKVPEDETCRLLYIIYDSFNSMWGELSDKSRKYEAGRTAMNSVLGLKLDGRDLAFRAYVHRDKTDCRDSELIVPASSATMAKPAIQKTIMNIRLPKEHRSPITFAKPTADVTMTCAPGLLTSIRQSVPC